MAQALSLPRRHSCRRWFSSTLAAAVLCAIPLPAQYGDARHGNEIFQRRNCVMCHSINGVGGTIAPDLARRSTRNFTPATLAATMWNHGPNMWQAMAERKIEVPALGINEINDLYAYFYSIRYFDRPGDAARGKTMFTVKKCSTCHATSPTQGKRVGPPLSEWPAIADRIRWTQQMLNHSGRMMEEMEKKGIPWPAFTVQEMVDLVVYVRNLPNRPVEPPALVFDNPTEGEKLFEQRGCVQCHTVGKPQAGKIDLIGVARASRTFTELGAAMWNHAPQMRRRAKEAHVEFPVLREDEMSNVIAYLFARRYFEEQGNPRAGQRVFAARRCETCHDQPGTRAPSLKAKQGQFSAPQMASAVWQHGPKMRAEMQKWAVHWPTFTGTEMADLIAFLNHR